MDLLLTLVACLAFFIIGVLNGWKARERHAERVLSHLLEETVTEKEQDDYIRILIEKHNDTFYVYDEKTNKFLAQGSSKKELEDTLHSMFPGKRFGAKEQNLIEVGFLS